MNPLPVRPLHLQCNAFTWQSTFLQWSLHSIGTLLFERPRWSRSLCPCKCSEHVHEETRWGSSSAPIWGSLRKQIVEVWHLSSIHKSHRFDLQFTSFKRAQFFYFKGWRIFRNDDKRRCRSCSSWAASRESCSFSKISSIERMICTSIEMYTFPKSKFLFNQGGLHVPLLVPIYGGLWTADPTNCLCIIGYCWGGWGKTHINFIW